MGVNQHRFADRLDREVSAVVRAEMARAMLPQATLALDVGMHPNVLGRKCRGESAFTAAELVAVATLLGLRAADITAEAEARVAGQGRSAFSSMTAARHTQERTP